MKRISQRKERPLTSRTLVLRLQRLPWGYLLEWGLIVGWACWVGAEYLNFDADWWPNGREFGMAIHPHYIWTLLDECGSCVLWNGFYNGGSPAFVELHAAVLHPLVVVSTLLFGGINGAKVIVIGSLAMAGFAQWWLAYEMDLGRVARLWGAGIAAAGGHLAGRMDIGVVGVVISTAACSLVLAPGLRLARSGRRKDVIPLAIVLALAIVSGQGYMQIGLLLFVMPAFLFLILDDNLKIRPVWREFVVAGVLALWLAGPFVVPFFHYWPEFGKGVDAQITAVQPLEYIPLNFVIRDINLYLSQQLGTLPYPYLHVNYIGWIPVLLAMLPLYFAKKTERRLLAFFGVGIGLLLLAGSGLPFIYLSRWLPVWLIAFAIPA